MRPLCWQPPVGCVCRRVCGGESCCQLARHNVSVSVYGRCWGSAPSCRQSLREVLAEEARRFVAARLAQPAERKALNLVVVGSSPTVGVFWFGCAKVGGSGVPNALPGRLELPTLRLTASRSNQLSYGSNRIVPWRYAMIGWGPATHRAEFLTDASKFRGRELNPGLPRDRRKY
jgi:hypothetical protein